MAKARSKTNGSTASDNQAVEAAQGTELVVNMVPDSRAVSTLTYGPPRHPIWFHPDVEEEVREDVQLRKRVGLVLHHLTAHGRTSVVKGCKDEANRGWRRSPLGGGGGNQYYLWWAPQGAAPLHELDLAPNTIVVRTVRHHDNHDPLNAARNDDYLQPDQVHLQDESMVGTPWTEEQLSFVDSEAPVRLLVGQPGSGKTTILWKAVDARQGQRVLYLTWSRELIRFAEEHFDTFAPKGVTVVAKDFQTFLGDLRGKDVERQTWDESLDSFQERLKKVPPSRLGPWANNPAFLLAEIRAYLFGHAIFGEDGTMQTNGSWRLSDNRYRQLRRRQNALNESATTSVLAVASILEEYGYWQEAFPELIASAEACEAIRSGKLNGYINYDRIVVDEVQDLTPAEFAVVGELVRAIAAAREKAPWLLIAGDEGQTVRPSGFDWGVLGTYLGNRINRPERFQLEENLRCPEGIASVIGRASQYYRGLNREIRPTRQGLREGGQPVNAQLLHLDVESREEAVEALAELVELDGVVVITPNDTVPEWVPEELAEAVLSPALAKGLEYQAVCVLDPGKLVQNWENEETSGVDSLMRRTNIDQLRVALSRASESLVFIDVMADTVTRKRSTDLLGSFAAMDAADLITHFSDPDATAEERVMKYIQEARVFVEERPRRAWLRICQAAHFLGEKNRPNSVHDQALREDTHLTLVATAARILVDGVPERLDRKEVIDEALRIFEDELGYGADAVALKQLVAWLAGSSVIEFLITATKAGAADQWLKPALVAVRQRLRQALETAVGERSNAPYFSGEVEAWLALLGFEGNVKDEALRLRRLAVDRLLALECVPEAVAVFSRVVSSEWVNLDDSQPNSEANLSRMPQQDILRYAAILEHRNQFEAAATAFEVGGSPSRALKCCRKAGNLERALKLAPEGSSDNTDLRWMLDLKKIAAEIPAEFKQRVTAAEERQILGAVDTFKKQVRR